MKFMYKAASKTEKEGKPTNSFSALVWSSPRREPGGEAPGQGQAALSRTFRGGRPRSPRCVRPCSLPPWRSVLSRNEKHSTLLSLVLNGVCVSLQLCMV